MRIVIAFAAALAAMPLNAAGAPQMDKEFAAAVQDYVSKQPDGILAIPDESLNKEWRLKLAGVDRKSVKRLGDRRYLGCADFKTAEGGKRDKLDLDFYATKTPGGWRVDNILIHKVNGEARYAYDKKNERVPVKKKK